MKPSKYRNEWGALEGGNHGPEKLQHFSTRIAMSFLDRYFFNDHFDSEYIKLLCEMATSDDPCTSDAASGALFGIIIEGLCDDFEELQTEAYNKVMSWIIEYCRKMPAGTELDSSLHGFGLGSFNDIYQRIERIRLKGVSRRRMKLAPAKILILSRVTIGADVAVTSVIVQRLSRLFPDSEIVIVGGGKLKSIFSGNPRLRMTEVDYSRRGGLIERLSAWHSVLEAVDSEASSVREGGMLLVDPDSRLSQLGVLPLVPDKDYVFFNSRGKDVYPKKASMAELTNFWLDSVFGKSEFCHPKVWLPAASRKKAASFASGIRGGGCGTLTAVNFGVGGNSRKRIDGDFEAELILSLLNRPDTVVLLDRGFGREELERSGTIMQAMRGKGFPVAETSFSELSLKPFKNGLVAVSADIGEAAALISEADEFIGYDSACQHIAAAQGVPTYTVFAGSNNTRFVRRWRACGSSKCEIIHVDTLSQPRLFETGDIIAIIRDLMEE